MHTFTALFDKRADAEAVQDRLTALGIVDLDHGVHDSETAGFDAGGKGEGLWTSPKGSVPPSEDRHLYEEAVRRGGVLLTVNVDDREAEAVAGVLEGSNAVDVDEREREMKTSGFVAPVPPPAAPKATAVGGDDKIQLVEEQLRVGKRQVDRGEVRVRAYVVETPVNEQVTLRQERVDVQRQPVNERVVGDASALFEPRSFEMTETSEEAVVAKEARVTEEVALRKVAGQRTETINDTVRRTEVEVERLPAGTPKPV